MRNYWNVNSMYICSRAGVCMHMTVYICIVCVRSRTLTLTCEPERRCPAGGLRFMMA